VSEFILVLAKNKMNIPLEIQIIKKFFKKEKQDRYIAFIASMKNRTKFIQTLSHLKDLQWELFKEVNSFDPKQIASNTAAHACYVISEDSSVDQTVLLVDNIKELTDSGNAFILVFGEAEQIYYEGEPPFNRYISKKL
jgi:folylpolyglutamate synthase/dihydropteroate synthase